MMLAVRKLPELPTRIGLGYSLQRILEGLPGSVDQGPRLALKDFLGHLLHGLFGSHGLLLRFSRTSRLKPVVEYSSAYASSAPVISF